MFSVAVLEYAYDIVPDCICLLLSVMIAESLRGCKTKGKRV